MFWEIGLEGTLKKLVLFEDMLVIWALFSDTNEPSNFLLSFSSFNFSSFLSSSFSRPLSLRRNDVV